MNIKNSENNQKLNKITIKLFRQKHKSPKLVRQYLKSKKFTTHISQYIYGRKYDDI